MNIFHKTKVQTCSVPQNDRLNLSFVKDIYVVAKKMTRSGHKTAIYRSQILGKTLYVLEEKIKSYVCKGDSILLSINVKLNLSCQVQKINPINEVDFRA